MNCIWLHWTHSLVLYWMHTEETNIHLLIRFWVTKFPHMLHTAHVPPCLNGQDEDFKVRRLRVAIWLPAVAEVQADFRVRPHALTLTERLIPLTVNRTDQDLTRQQLDGERQTGRDTQVRHDTLPVLEFSRGTMLCYSFEFKSSRPVISSMQEYQSQCTCRDSSDMIRFVCRP